MEPHLTLASIQSSLEAQIAHHREQEAIHAEREAFHRDRRAEHAAELAQLVHHLETFTTSATGAAQLAARRPLATAPPLPTDDLPPRSLSTNKLVARVIEDKAPNEPFTLRTITAEVNRRFASRLKKPLDGRQVSVSLRWLAKSGHIFRLEKGKPHSASKYVRQRPVG
jgi:hypothetical protein